MQEFIDEVSDKIIEYLRDNKTQDMQEVRNIISLHFSEGLVKVFYDEEAELAMKVQSCLNSPGSERLSGNARTMPWMTTRRSA